MHSPKQFVLYFEGLSHNQSFMNASVFHPCLHARWRRNEAQEVRKDRQIDKDREIKNDTERVEGM